MKYKSEIRDSDIAKLLEKVEKKSYGKYLLKITLESIRGFKNETIQFDFPVTALIAPNGGGKSTILGVAACAYKTVKPGRFFKNTAIIDDDTTKHWKILFELIDKEVNHHKINSTIQFKNNRWDRKDLPIRDVAIFSVSRTLPATERKILTQYASVDFKCELYQQKILSKTVISNSSKVLGKDLTGYSQINIDVNIILKGQTTEGIPISEFHFGAGESSVLRMITKIETLKENAFILIEELENGLHPIAVRRLVEYLIDVAKRKNAQIIFTTHSNDALMPLPSKAIWSAINNKLYQGKLDVKSLRAMTGEVEASLAVFVEDKFAKMWVEAIISDNADISEGEIEIHYIGGDGNAVTINEHNNASPITKCKSICIIDGDSQLKNVKKDKVYCLPGEHPEQYIFDNVFDLISNDEAKMKELSLLLHKKDKDSTKILEGIKTIKTSCRDHHLLFVQIGKEIGYTSEEVVIKAFLRLWITYNAEESGKIWEIIEENITNP
jgi:predicted ATPase